jgi:hypothetical protein
MVDEGINLQQIPGQHLSFRHHALSEDIGRHHLRQGQVVYGWADVHGPAKSGGRRHLGNWKALDKALEVQVTKTIEVVMS